MLCPNCSTTYPKLTVVKIENNTKKFCYACGIIIANKEGYLSCNYCKKVNICSNCKICPQGHTLSKVYFLQNLPNTDEDSLYIDNEYNCDSCTVNIKNGLNGVWHCGPCDYDLCDKCIDDDLCNKSVD